MYTRSTAMPTSSVSDSSSEADSLTGISSGNATIATPVASWSVMKRSSSSAWECTGPTRAMLAKVRGVWRKPIPWPVAGADQNVSHRPHPELQQQVLAQRLVRVDRDRPEVVGDLDLVEADLGTPEH